MEKGFLILLTVTLLLACGGPKKKSNGTNTSVNEDNVSNKQEIKSLADLSLDFVNTRYQAYLCVQLVTFKNASGNEHFERLRETESPKLWNPKNGMDVKQWADVLIDSKMEGGWLTTKHHGGFCLWDSKYTDYDVGASSNKEDVVQKFVDEFRSRGLKVGLYYSILDYHHGIINGEVTEEKLQFLKNQITELLTNYGPIDYINFDGWATWPTVPTFDDVPYFEIFETVKRLQPNCLIINHTYESNISHADIPFADAAGRKYPYHPEYLRPTAGSDFIQTDWFWDDENFDVAKSKEYILSQLDSYNSHNGVYILNVAPNVDGRIPDDAVKRLKEVANAWEKPKPLSSPGEKWGYQYNVKENLAFMKPCSQSSTHGFIRDKRAYPRAEIALDGVTDGDCMMEQTSWTLVEDAPWWKVDLIEDHEINEITIYNRTDGDVEQLKDFKVSILGISGSVVWESVQKDTPLPSVTISVPKVKGRYVKIQLMNKGALALAEVIVK